MEWNVSLLLDVSLSSCLFTDFTVISIWTLIKVSLYRLCFPYECFKIWKQSKAREQVYTNLKRNAKKLKIAIERQGKLHINYLNPVLSDIWGWEERLWLKYICVKIFSMFFLSSNGDEWTTHAKTCEYNSRFTLQQFFIRVLLT